MYACIVANEFLWLHNAHIKRMIYGGDERTKHSKHLSLPLHTLRWNYYCLCTTRAHFAANFAHKWNLFALESAQRCESEIKRATTKELYYHIIKSVFVKTLIEFTACAVVDRVTLAVGFLSAYAWKRSRTTLKFGNYVYGDALFLFIRMFISLALCLINVMAKTIWKQLFAQ